MTLFPPRPAAAGPLVGPTGLGPSTETASAGPAHVHEGLRHRLAALAHEACAQVGPADGAGVTLLLGGGPVTAGSDACAEALETLQHTLGEGPAPDALTRGSAVRSYELDGGETRWQQLVAQARGYAVRGVVAVPLLAGDDRLGSLTLWYRTAEGAGTVTEADLRRLASTTLQSLFDVRLGALLVEASRFLADARRDRTEVDLAVGLLADRYGFTANQALVLVVQLARQDGVSAAAASRALTGRTGG